MQRRELLKTIALATGVSFIGGTAWLTGCKTGGGKRDLSFTDKDIALLDEVAETILPSTPGSRGAKAAKTGEYMKVMVTDCYEPAEQEVFMNGISELDKACKAKFSKTFMECTPQQRTELLNELNKEAKTAEDARGKAMAPLQEKFKWLTPKQQREEIAKAKIPPHHYFTMMMQLSIAGYFSSEIGSTEARRHEAVPGRYDGCLPYKKGDKAWAE